MSKKKLKIVCQNGQTNRCCDFLKPLKSILHQENQTVSYPLLVIILLHARSISKYETENVC